VFILSAGVCGTAKKHNRLLPGSMGHFYLKLGAKIRLPADLRILGGFLLV
jgi:hypothetical protein